MAPQKKSKGAKASENINTKLQLVVKSGKVGYCWEIWDELVWGAERGYGPADIGLSEKIWEYDGNSSRGGERGRDSIGDGDPLTVRAKCRDG